MYFSKDPYSVPTFESPWIHWGWTLATTFMPESEEELKSLLMKVKVLVLSRV